MIDRQTDTRDDAARIRCRYSARRARGQAEAEGGRRCQRAYAWHCLRAMQASCVRSLWFDVRNRWRARLTGELGV
jgi:hypothetical protein|eukprot:COSAG06_NODE_3861_length_4823_cov_3.709356_3_plen_75_part_00